MSGTTTFRLSHKPRLIPIGVNGQPLSAETIVTLEFRPPGYVVLGPESGRGQGSAGAAGTVRHPAAECWLPGMVAGKR